MTPQQWDQDLAEKAREDLKPSEDRSPEELELIIATVRKLLEHSGQETESGILTFEGRRYQMIGTKNLQNVGIVAKDGRGLILSLKNGVLEGMLTESDLEVFRHLEQALEEYLAKNERSPSRERQRTKERDRGGELEP